MRKYLANGGYSHDDTRSFAARVFRSGVGALERAAGQQPFALIVDTYEPHERGLRLAITSGNTAIAGIAVPSRPCPATSA